MLKFFNIGVNSLLINYIKLIKENNNCLIILKVDNFINVKKLKLE